MLELTGLTKSYGDFRALKEVNFTFNKGLYGLLGTNGAGKTTLLKLICGLMRSDAGMISYNGRIVDSDSKLYRGFIGYLPQKFGFIPNYTAPEFLQYMATLKGIELARIKNEISDLIEIFDLKYECKKPMRALSGGNAQRVGIAQAMLGAPDILILDEPTVGLDPRERINIRNIISSYAKDHTVIFSTHIVPDISNIAGEILIMNHGEIIRNGSEKQLYKDFKSVVWSFRVTSEDAKKYYDNFCVINTFVDEGGIELRVISKEKPSENAVSVKPTLEDFYLYYCGEDKSGC